MVVILVDLQMEQVQTVSMADHMLGDFMCVEHFISSCCNIIIIQETGTMVKNFFDRMYLIAA
jgi:hypothetical protein